MCLKPLLLYVCDCCPLLVLRLPNNFLFKCLVSTAKGVFLLPTCVCPPLPTTGDPPPVHFMQAHPDVYSCVVKGCPLKTKELLPTMMSPVHVDTVTQWLQTTRVLSYSWAVNVEQQCLIWMVDVHSHMKIMQYTGRRLSGSVCRLTLLHAVITSLKFTGWLDLDIHSILHTI